MKRLRLLQKRRTPEDIDPGDDTEPDLKEVCSFCSKILYYPCIKLEQAKGCVNYRPIVPQPQPPRKDSYEREDGESKVLNGKKRRIRRAK